MLTLLIAALFFAPMAIANEMATELVKITSSSKEDINYKLLEESFKQADEAAKTLLAYTLSFANPGQTENHPIYYTKYALKKTKFLSPEQACELKVITADYLLNTFNLQSAQKNIAEIISRCDEKYKDYAHIKMGWIFVNQEKYQDAINYWIKHEKSIARSGQKPLVLKKMGEIIVLSYLKQKSPLQIPATVLSESSLERGLKAKLKEIEPFKLDPHFLGHYSQFKNSTAEIYDFTQKTCDIQYLQKYSVAENIIINRINLCLSSKSPDYKGMLPLVEELQDLAHPAWFIRAVVYSQNNKHEQACDAYLSSYILVENEEYLKAIAKNCDANQLQSVIRQIGLSSEIILDFTGKNIVKLTFEQQKEIINSLEPEFLSKLFPYTLSHLPLADFIINKVTISDKMYFNYLLVGKVEDKKQFVSRFKDTNYQIAAKYIWNMEIEAPLDMKVCLQDQQIQNFLFMAKLKNNQFDEEPCFSRNIKTDENLLAHFIDYKLNQNATYQLPSFSSLTPKRDFKKIRQDIYLNSRTKKFNFKNSFYKYDDYEFYKVISQLRNLRKKIMKNSWITLNIKKQTQNEYNKKLKQIEDIAKSKAQDKKLIEFLERMRI